MIALMKMCSLNPAWGMLMKSFLSVLFLAHYSARDDHNQSVKKRLSEEVMLRTGNPYTALQKRIHFNQRCCCSISIVDMICDHICFIFDVAAI